MAVAQRIEHFSDDEEGSGFESHQSHALSEALGFRHLEPLSSFEGDSAAKKLSELLTGFYLKEASAGAGSHIVINLL